MTEQDLLKLKESIEKAKTAMAELNGQMNALTSQLKEWDCKTVEEAETKLAEMEKEISNFNNKIALGTEELQKKYNV
jgi:CII-binding regulator of phage lambda lysogenization HflD